MLQGYQARERADDGSAPPMLTLTRSGCQACVKWESSTAAGTLETTWLNPAETTSPQDSISEPKKSLTAGTRARLPGEHEEAAKREEQRVIDAAKRRPIGDGEHRDDDDQHDNRGTASNTAAITSPSSAKQTIVLPRETPSAPRALRAPGCAASIRVGAGVEIAQGRKHRHGEDKRHRHGERKRHDAHERAHAHVEIREQVQVLRIAERNDHAAEVRAEALKREDERNEPRPARPHERRRRKREHHHESHVVRRDHRQGRRGA